MTKIIKESFRNFFENFCLLSRNQILQISITRKKRLNLLKRLYLIRNSTHLAVILFLS